MLLLKSSAMPDYRSARRRCTSCRRGERKFSPIRRYRNPRWHYLLFTLACFDINTADSGEREKVVVEGACLVG